jgi:cardiolipin synthase
LKGSVNRNEKFRLPALFWLDKELDTYFKVFRRLIIFLFLFTVCLGIKAQAQVRSDSLTVAFLRSQGIEFSDNNRVTLLTSGTDKFTDLFTAIRQAKRSIHLEYFNFRNDSIAKALFDLLATKARQGVAVRALFDGFGNDSNNKPLKRKHIRLIRSLGIQIHEFDPLVFPYINHALHRDHRKIVVIDGEVAYMGGMNVADYYIKGLPKIGDWRDMHMRIEGDAVGYLQRIFITMWNKTTHENISGPEYYPGYRDASKDFKSLKPDTTATSGSKKVGILDRVPRQSPAIIRKAYQVSIDNARHLVQIVNPYFTLNRHLKRSIKKAIQRGVRVEIMVSTKSDIPITPNVVAYTVHKLMKAGAHIYYFNGGFNHSKVMMVDSLFCTVGSANLNARSLAWDYEVNAFIIDPHTTMELSRIFEADKLNSTYLTPAEWKKRSAGSRFVGWLFHFVSSFI